MRRLVLLGLAGGMLLSQPICGFAAFAQPRVPDIALEEQLMASERRALAAEQNAALQIAVDRLEDAQTAQAYNRFEIWMGVLVGFFSVLVTILVVIFGFRTARVAAVEAATAAQREISGAKGEIETLAEAARGATEAARLAALTANELLEQARLNIEVWEGKARAASQSAEASAQQAGEAYDKVRRGVEALRESVERTQRESAEEGGQKVTLTEAQAAALQEGVAATPVRPEAEWTADEFRLRVGKAAYIDRDSDEALRLASLMGKRFQGDRRASAFAMLHKGAALENLQRFDEALVIYSELIETYKNDSDPQISSDVLSARHARASMLASLEEFEAAKSEYEHLLSLAEQQHGPSAEATLAIRTELARLLCRADPLGTGVEMLESCVHNLRNEAGSEDSYVLTVQVELAVAKLLRGLAKEAGDALEELILTLEKVEGKEHVHTLIARLEYARTLVFRGELNEAERQLEAILEIRSKVEGPEHRHTILTRFELAKVRLLKGEATAAEPELRLLAERMASWRPRNPGVTVAQMWLAWSLLDLGQIQEADSILLSISDPPDVTYWRDRWEATLAYLRARSAKLSGRTAEAERWIDLAIEMFSAPHLRETIERRRFEAFRTGRG